MRLAGLLGVALALLLVAAAGPAAAEDLKPGEQEAVNEALENAVEEALREATRTIPEDVDSFAVLPLGNDPDGLATDRVQYYAVKLTQGRAKVVNRDDATWQKLLEEFKFTEKRIDILADEEVRKFGKLLGADALLYGWVRERGMDATGLKGVAKLTVYLGVVETGQLARTGSGDQKVAIGAGGFIKDTMGGELFWPIAGAVLVALLIFILIWIPLRRKMALAAKPREVVR